MAIETTAIEIRRTGDSTWSLRDSKRGFIYPYPSPYSNTRKPPRPELPQPQVVMSYTAIRPTTSYYVMLHLLCHTNLEYCVIENHLSASGLRLAPQLTHAPSDQYDDHGAGDKLIHLWRISFGQFSAEIACHKIAARTLLPPWCHLYDYAAHLHNSFSQTTKKK